MTGTTTPRVAGHDERPPATEAEVAAYRRGLRRRFWGWSAPAVLVVLLVAVKLLSLLLFAALSQWAYSDRAFERAAGLTAPLGVLNVVEPWVHHFDRGAAYAQVGVLEVARQEFTRALDLAPEDDRVSCVIRVDLVLTIEAQGDAAVLDLRFADAQALYEQGLQVVEEAPEGCFEPPSSPQEPDTQQPLDDARERLDEKGEQAEGDQGDPQDGGGGDQEGDEGSPEEGEGDGGSGGQDPLEQLREQGEESQREQQQEQDRRRDAERDPDDYDGRPW